MTLVPDVHRAQLGVTVPGIGVQAEQGRENKQINKQMKNVNSQKSNVKRYYEISNGSQSLELLSQLEPFPF